jgi:DNA-binding helix-turn-helix protein
MDIRTERILIEFTKTGLRQTDICNLTGISRSLMSSYLSGRCFPKQDNYEKLAQVFGVSVDYLRGFERDYNER